MNFEKSLNELENVVKKLETDASLDEAIELFQKGIELSRVCVEDLKKQKGKISLLIDEINNLTEELKVD
ncbi:MAG TPA: exodeoxyribonuclease VII small subunit [Clostridia bacterium]|nr:exodeoxyribonuclease VII small subunit [Clostridia bacterium]